MRGGYEPWDTVWNPTRGCTPVSEGCENCTAARLAAYSALATEEGRETYRGLVRWGEKPTWTGRVKVDLEMLLEPHSWDGNRQVFVGSMGDLFHPQVNDSVVGEVFKTMLHTPRHTYFISTKYPGWMEQWFGTTAAAAVVDEVERDGLDWPLTNLALGISAENQTILEDRAASLMMVPAASKFLLLEPLMSEIDLTQVECPVMRGGRCGVCGNSHVGGDTFSTNPCINGYYSLLDEEIQWVIVGGETGPVSRVRGMKMEWVANLRDQCELANIPFCFKQLQDRGRRVSLPLINGRQWNESPV